MRVGESFSRDGFAMLPGLFPLDLIENIERSTVHLAHHLLRQAGEASERLPRQPLELFRFAEARHPEVFYQLCYGMGGTLAGYNLVSNWRSLDALKEVERGSGTMFFPTLPAMFWNDRSVKRLQYDWHQEASYFGDIQKTLTIWFPLFRDITTDDGPMLMAAGSHAGVMEYEVDKKERSLLQLRILDNVETKFTIHECVLNRGDAVLFGDKVAHKTGENRSDLPRVSGIIRYVDAMSSSRFCPMMSFSYKDDTKLAKRISESQSERVSPEC